MYFIRILVNVFFLVSSISLIFAATTTTPKLTTTGKVGAYNANFTTARTAISKNVTSSKIGQAVVKNGTSWRIGQTTVNGTKTGGAAGSANRIIATRFGADGNTVEEECQCTVFYLCPPESKAATSIECPDPSYVCCIIPSVGIAIPNSAPYSSGNAEPPVASVPQQSSTDAATDCTCAKKSECSDPDLIKGGGGLINPRFQCESPDVCCPNDKLIKINGVSSPPIFVQPTNTSAQECVCVRNDECLDQEYVSGGGGNINPRFGCVQPQVCCPPDKVQYSNNPIPTPYYPPLSPPPPTIITEPTTVSFSPSYPQLTDPIKANPDYCGKRQSVEKRITAPEDWAKTDFGEFPWMVLILEMQFASDGSSIDKGLLCGGSLVSGTVVLTAAHCIYKKDKNTMKVRAGEYDTRVEAYEPKIHQDRLVDRISMHEKFHSSVLFNDIALIRVTESFNFDSHVFPICVPLTQSWYAEPQIYDPTQCVATGWGKNDFHNGEYQNTLKKVDLSIFPRGECQSELQKTKLGKQFELHSSFICAKGLVGHDTCKGDGGGPLVCALRDHPNTYVQVGIVAWGIECGNDVPAVYASLEANKEWLTTEFNSMSVFSRMG